MNSYYGIVDGVSRGCAQRSHIDSNLNNLAAFARSDCGFLVDVATLLGSLKVPKGNIKVAGSLLGPSSLGPARLFAEQTMCPLNEPCGLVSQNSFGIKHLGTVGQNLVPKRPHDGQGISEPIAVSRYLKTVVYLVAPRIAGSILHKVTHFEVQTLHENLNLGHIVDGDLMGDLATDRTL